MLVYLYMCHWVLLSSSFFWTALRGHLLSQTKSYLDGILREEDPHQWPEEKKIEAEAEVCHVPGVAVEVGVGAEASVQKTRQDQKHLIPRDLERNLQNQRAKDQKLRKQKRMPKGKGVEGSFVFIILGWNIFTR